jgi:excisionase family DNA binding protein
MTDLLSLRQAARRLGVAERVLRQAVRSGALPAFKLGERTLRVKPNDLDDWIQDRRVRPWSAEPR